MERNLSNPMCPYYQDCARYIGECTDVTNCPLFLSFKTFSNNRENQVMPTAYEAHKLATQSNEERDKIIFEKVKEAILEAIKKGYMYCEVEMLPASIVERLEELGYTVDEVKVKYHGADPYTLISWPIDDDDY